MTEAPMCKLQSHSNLEDWISQLPDGALVDILSLLKLKEAGRSSVLSKRWRDLWKSTTRLNFDAPRALHTLKCTSSKMIRDTETCKYVTWVNEVLRSHERSTTIDEFKVQFNLDASASDVIDEWIKFAIRKRAKRVEIDLTPYVGAESYTLSEECYHYLKSVSNLSNIMNLRSLSLGQVNVDGRLLEYLLSKCPHLEMLSISLSNQLVNLKVDGPSLQLKYLEIRNCSSLESIVLSAPKLETFIYFGHVVNLLLGSNPLLAELNIGGGSGRENVVTCCLGLFESYFSQLESLTLSMTLEHLWEDVVQDLWGDDSEDELDIPQVSEFRNLKYLKLIIHASDNRSLLGFTRFVDAAPSLAKLSLELNVKMHFPMDEHTSIPVMSGTLIQPHHCLKEVEIFGYSGNSGGFDLAWYLIKAATNLEKMVIDPYCRDGYKSRKGIDERKLQLLKDKDVLTGMLPPGAKLIVKKLY